MDETNPHNNSNLSSSSPDDNTPLSTTHNPSEPSSSSSIPNPITHQQEVSVAEMISSPTPTFDIAEASSSSSSSTPFDGVQKEQEHQQVDNPSSSNVGETIVLDFDSPSSSSSNASLLHQQQQQPHQQQQQQEEYKYMEAYQSSDGRIMIPYPYSRKRDAFLVKESFGGPGSPCVKQLIPRPEMEIMLERAVANMNSFLSQQLPRTRSSSSSSMALKISSDSHNIKKPSFKPYTYLRPRRSPLPASSDDTTFKVPPLPPPRPPTPAPNDSEAGSSSGGDDVVEFSFTILEDEDDDDDDDWPSSDEDNDDDDGDEDDDTDDKES